MKNLYILIALVFFSISCSSHLKVSKQELQSKLPMDSRMVQGKLENGLEYYIYKNSKPKNEAIFRLIVKVGSLQETESQLGAAHYVEHMAFNGTKHFKKNDIIDFFRSTGMAFGHDLNAHTGWDETIYKFRIPLNNPKIKDQAFVVLSDWINGISFDPVETEKERNIIIEEWRNSRGVFSRAYKKQFYPAFFNNSRHMKRFPIGKLKIIQKISAKELKQFYTDWYNPKNMAVVIVGDINTQKMKSKIINAFSKIKNKQRAPQLVKYPLTKHKELLFTTVTDPELQDSSIQIIQKTPISRLTFENDFKEHLIEKLYLSILDTRIQLKDKKGNAVGDGSFYKKQQWFRFINQHQFYIKVQKERYSEALEETLVDLERIKRFGFHESELERAKKIILTSTKNRFQERDKTLNKTIVTELVDAAIKGKTFISVETNYNLTKKYLQNIQLADLNSAREKYNSDNNRIVGVFSTKKQIDNPLSFKKVKLMQNDIKLAELKPVLDEVSDLPFFISQMTPGKIITEKKHEKIGVTIWELSNGIRVILKPTDFKEEEILITAYSPGGYSMIPKDEYWSARLATSVFMNSGLGPFSRTDLIKRLIFKDISLDLYVNFYEEGVNGKSSPEDFETFLQVVNLGVTQPGFDKDIFQEKAISFAETQKNNRKTAKWKFYRELGKTAFPKSAWLFRPTSQDIESLDAEVSRLNLLRCLKNTGDFTFQFVGNFELEWIKPLILKYIATLPGGEKEEVNDLGINPIAGNHKVVVNENIENQSTIILTLSHSFPYSEKMLLEFDTLEKLLNLKITREIRENQSLVYGAGVDSQSDTDPKPDTRFTFYANCAPENVNKIITLYKQILQDFRSSPVNQKDLEVIKKSHQDKLKNNLLTNNYWNWKLKSMISQNKDPNDILQFQAWIDQITPETVLESAKKYLKTDNLITGVLNPKSKSI